MDVHAVLQRFVGRAMTPSLKEEMVAALCQAVPLPKFRYKVDVDKDRGHVSVCVEEVDRSGKAESDFIDKLVRVGDDSQTYRVWACSIDDDDDLNLHLVFDHNNLRAETVKWQRVRFPRG